MKQKRGSDHGSNHFNKADSGFTTVHFKNGMYQGEMSFRQKNGLGTYYWDSGEFYFGWFFLTKVFGARTSCKVEVLRFFQARSSSEGPLETTSCKARPSSWSAAR